MVDMGMVRSAYGVGEGCIGTGAAFRPIVQRIMPEGAIKVDLRIEVVVNRQRRTGPGKRRLRANFSSCEVRALNVLLTRPSLNLPARPCEMVYAVTSTLLSSFATEVRVCLETLGQVAALVGWPLVEAAPSLLTASPACLSCPRLRGSLPR